MVEMLALVPVPTVNPMERSGVRMAAEEVPGTPAEVVVPTGLSVPMVLMSMPAPTAVARPMMSITVNTVVTSAALAPARVLTVVAKETSTEIPGTATVTTAVIVHSLFAATVT